MKELQRGDRVKFLNEKGSGSVTRLIDKQMVMVRTDDGFEYPVLRSELINTSIDESIVREKDVNAGSEVESLVVDRGTEAVKTAGSQSKETVRGPVNVYLAVEPRSTGEPVGGEADILLVNDSSYMILYHCSIRINENLCETISAGTIEPDTKIIIGTEHLDDLFGSGRGLGVSYIPFGNGRQPHLLPVNQNMRPGREYMSTRAAYTENDFTDGDSWLVKIETGAVLTQVDELVSQLRDSIATIVPAKEEVRKTVVQSVKELNTEEVDLHIGEITEDVSGLAPGEILGIQIARFRTSLDGAIRARQKKIVFIHGTGEGKLKHEIRRIIDREYPRCNYQDASFREYGFGATMVIIR